MDRAMPIYLSPSSLNFLLGSQHTCHFESWQVREGSGWRSINHNENCEESKGIFCPSPTLPDIARHTHPGELCGLSRNGAVSRTLTLPCTENGSLRDR